MTLITESTISNKGKKEKKYTIYNYIVALLFFFFFTAPILSPYIGNYTIYLYWFIPFLDIGYINYILKYKYDKKFIIVMIVMTLFLIFFNRYMLLVKIASVLITINYLFYTRKLGLFRLLYKNIFLNVFICIIQFLLIYVDIGMAYKIGPTNISTMIWGKYATPCFTNFYSIFIFPRVCGLSREAGFFASLLGMTFILFMFDKNEKKSGYKYVIFLIGFILSFSKVSLLFLVIFLIIKMRNIINKIPLFVGVALFISMFMIFSSYLYRNNYYKGENESLIHRISGYTIMYDLPIGELIKGTDSIQNLSNYSKYSFLQNILKFNEFTGIPNIVVNQGLLVFIVFILILYLFGIRFDGFIILSLITFTTDFFTCTSFVALGYYFVFIYSASNKKRLN